MSGIADQLKLWAKGRKPPSKEDASKGGKDEPKGQPATSLTPNKDDEATEPPKGQQPPFGKATSPGKPEEEKDSKNPLDAFAKKAKKDGGKFPPFGGKKAPPFTKEGG